MQQLSYFITVFVAAPVSIITGLLQSPAISNRLGWLDGAQPAVARSVHFISFPWFVSFILAHGVMVFITGISQNTNHMFAGVECRLGRLSVLRSGHGHLRAGVVGRLSVHDPQRPPRPEAGRFLIGWLKGLSEWWEPTAQMTEGHLAALLAKRHDA